MATTTIPDITQPLPIVTANTPTPVNPTLATPTDVVKPADMTVAPNQTVASQVQGIINQNSPLMQQAKAGAMDQMNARGLINSSMAIGAGQDAVYRAALPIAQQDANTYQNTAAANFQSANQIADQNAAAKNTASGQNAQLGTQTSLTNSDLSAKTAQFNASQSNDMQKLGIDEATKTNLADIEASYKVLMQGNQSASTIYTQAVKNISEIAANQSMTPEAKNQAVNNQIAMLQKGMELTGAMANLDLGQYLNFGSVPKAA